MSKQILSNEKARQSVKNGIDKAVDLVKSTIGPIGGNVAIASPVGSPNTTNDGVSVVKSLTFEDPFENMGLEIVKDAASKTNDAAGDGTTSTSVLLQAIVDEGMKKIDTGLNVIGLKRGMDLATKDIIEWLKENAKKIEDSESIKQVATISAESDEMGAIIAETIEQIGVDGVVTVEDSHTLGMTAEIVNGLKIDTGYISPYMVTDEQRMEALYTGMPVLIIDGKLNSTKKFKPLLEEIVKSDATNLLIIAEEVTPEVLSVLVINKLNGILGSVAVKAPSYGADQKETLQDIAAMTGAKVISEAKGMKLEEAKLDVLGMAKKVVVTKDSTTIIEGLGDGKVIEDRIANVKATATDAKTDFDKERINKRVANMLGGIAVIRVGAATVSEMTYIKLKIEDAVNATQAAIEEGVVSGGGSALTQAAHNISRDLTGEEKTGYEVIRKACTAPLRQIGINAGKGDGSIVVSKVQEMGEMAGYNAAEDVYVDDMIKEGIIDPVKVTRNAIQNAASAASTFLTIRGAIAEVKHES
jgi:chaperonin GroEL